MVQDVVESLAGIESMLVVPLNYLSSDTAGHSQIDSQSHLYRQVSGFVGVVPSSPWEPSN